VRWPDGQETSGYSPSTIIYDHLDNDGEYALSDFLQRVERALGAASERVKEVKGFYCSSAMDTLASLQYHGGRYPGGGVKVFDMQIAGAVRVTGGWSSF
jgi:uncharacterized repeat protein (TIGR04042 family)